MSKFSDKIVSLSLNDLLSGMCDGIYVGTKIQTMPIYILVRPIYILVHIVPIYILVLPVYILVSHNQNQDSII